MRKDEKVKKLAKRLVALSLEEGRVAPVCVEAVLEALHKKPYHHAKPLLKQYLFYIKREIARTQATVECAGTLSQETLTRLSQHLSDVYQRSIEVTPQETPALLAGVRIRIGDDVWDNSAATRLQALKENN